MLIAKASSKQLGAAAGCAGSAGVDTHEGIGGDVALHAGGVQVGPRGIRDAFNACGPVLAGHNDVAGAVLPAQAADGKGSLLRAVASLPEETGRLVLAASIKRLTK